MVSRSVKTTAVALLALLVAVAVFLGLFDFSGELFLSAIAGIAWSCVAAGSVWLVRHYPSSLSGGPLRVRLLSGLVGGLIPLATNAVAFRESSFATEITVAAVVLGTCLAVYLAGVLTVVEQLSADADGDGDIGRRMAAADD